MRSFENALLKSKSAVEITVRMISVDTNPISQRTTVSFLSQLFGSHIYCNSSYCIDFIQRNVSVNLVTCKPH